MQASMKDTEESAPEQTEGHVEWFARVSWIITFVLASVAAAFLLLAEASSLWEYVAYPLLTALPALFGVLSSRFVSQLHVELLRGQQARLMLRTMEFEKMASHDELTQLYNRRYFYERFQGELERARVSKQTLALIVLDIDGLKKINDEYGHAVGDVMIANLAHVIDRHIRTSDVPARLGGDEFAVLMPDTDKRGAFALAQRLWAELEQAPMYEHEGLSLLLNVSIGVSGFPWGGETVDEMMHWADSDMYANKVSRRLPQAALSHREPKITDDPRLEDFDRI
jgi:diguanylate cyclase (GGDEF)-like protein